MQIELNRHNMEDHKKAVVDMKRGRRYG